MTCWLRLTQYLRVAATVNKLFRTQFQLNGNLLNNRGTKCCCGVDRCAGVSTLCGYDYLQGWHGPPSCIHSHPVPETQVVRERCQVELQMKVVIESLEECYLKRRNREQISGLRLLSKKPTAGSQLEFWSFSRIYTAVFSNRGNLPLSLMLVHHMLLPWISPQISLASWLNPLAFPIEVAAKPGPRRRGHHQTRWSLGKSCPSHLHARRRECSVFLTKLRTRLSEKNAQHEQADFFEYFLTRKEWFIICFECN